MIVDEDEVERRGHRHLPAAKAAERDHGKAAAGDMAVRGGEGLGDNRQCGTQAGIGDIGERGRGLDREEKPAQHVHADVEDLVVGPAPLGIEEVLQVPCVERHVGELGLHFFRAELSLVEHAHEPSARHGRELGPQFVGVRHVQVGELAAEHAVEQHRPVFQPIGETGRRTHDLRNQVEQLGVCREHGKEVRACG